MEREPCVYTYSGSVRTFCKPNAVSKYAIDVDGLDVRMIISPYHDDAVSDNVIFDNLHLSKQWIDDDENADVFNILWDHFSEHLHFDPRGFYKAGTTYDKLPDNIRPKFTEAANMIRVKYPSITPIAGIEIADHNPFFPIKGKLETRIWYAAGDMEAWEPCKLHITTGIKDRDLRAVKESWLRKNRTYRIGVLVEGHVKANIKRSERLRESLKSLTEDDILTPKGALELRRSMLLY